MISFTVHEPPNPPADRLDRAERLEFVRDGFTYSAFAFAPFWLLLKKQWLAFVVYLGALVAILFGLAALDARSEAVLIASSALHVLIGFEADSIQRWTLAQRGYTMIGTVSGRTQLECERNFLDDWLPRQPMLAPVDGVGASGTMVHAGHDMAAEMALPSGRSWLGLLKRS